MFIVIPFLSHLKNDSFKVCFFCFYKELYFSVIPQVKSEGYKHQGILILDSKLHFTLI